VGVKIFDKMRRNVFLIALVSAVLVIIIIFFFQPSGASSFESIENFDGEITIYKSLSCGCCGLYANYFESRGNKDVKVIDMEDLSAIKKEYGVPLDLESCHMTVVGNYFVEGHVPLEAIDKLLSERPDIAGIAMPGMPSGSPGMPGQKYGEFIVYSVNKDGSYSEFMGI